MMKLIFLLLIATATTIAGACSDPEAAKQQAFENGDRYFEEKKYAEAIVEYRNAIQYDPRFGEARQRLADTYLQVKNARLAYAEQIRAADLLPHDMNAQLKAAAYLLLTRQFEDAKTRVERVLVRDPKNVEALIVLGNAAAGLGDLETAIREIQQAIELDPTRSGSYTNLADFELAQGDQDQAVAAYEKAVATDPKSVPARISLAMYRWRIGDLMGAEQGFKAALELDPKHVLANRALGNYYILTRRGPEAEPHLKTIAETGGDPAKIALAEYYVLFGRNDDARRVLAPLVRDGSPSSTDAEIRLAQIAYVEKRVEAAHGAVDKVLVRDPKHSAALLVKARWLYGEGKLSDANRDAVTAVGVDPESAMAHHVLGTIQSASRDIEGATKSFTEVLRLNPRATAAQVQLSRLTLARGDAPAAIQFAQEAVKNSPNNPIARLTLARGLLAQGQTVRAETEISALLKEYPNAAPVNALNGALRATKKDLGGARAAYERALKLDPNSIEALNGLTLLDMTSRNSARARTRLETQLAAQPDRPEVLILAARVYFAEKDFSNTERVLRHLVEVDPSSMTGYSLLGQAYLAQKKVDAAKAEFEKRIERNPKDVTAHLVVAMILESQNNLAEAKKRYDQVLAIDGRSVIAANNLAYLYADANENLDRALDLAQTAVKQAPDNAAVQDTLGWVYYQKQLLDLAVRAFEQSIENEPNNPMFHYHLGLAHVRNGDLVRGRRALQAALKLKPDYAEAQRALSSIAG